MFVWQDMVLTGEEELERSSSSHAEVLLVWQHFLHLGAELGLRVDFDATRLLGKLFCGNLGLPRSTLKFHSFSLMSLLA